MEEVVILNVDSNTLETPFDDLKRIPSDVVKLLFVCVPLDNACELKGCKSPGGGRGHHRR